MRIGRSAVAALIRPPSPFLSASVVVQLMGNISATAKTEACTGTTAGKDRRGSGVEWELGGSD